MRNIVKLLSKVVVSILCYIPDVTTYQPITKEMVDKYKESRDKNILWADEV